MKLCKKFYSYALVLFALILADNTDVFGQSERGLHFTPEEVQIWRQRAISGPYKSAGDASTGSPGDWTRILNQANAFLADPSKERFLGGDGNYHNEPHKNHVNMKDAAFVYLITRDKKYFDAVRKELLAQIQIPGTDPSKWAYIGDMGRWVSAEWISRLLFSYDYIKDDLTSAERTQLDQWFDKAGKYFTTNIHQNLVLLFPNRLKEDYSVRGRDALSGSMRDKYTHVNKDGSKGNLMSYLSSWYNNRRSVQMRTVGLIGAFLNDMNMQFHAKLYVKELLMFSTYPDGTMGEYERNGNYGNPQAGMTYSAFNIQSATDIADVLARKGDFELYNYSTSQGLHGTQGGNKNIKLLVENYYRQTDLSVERFYQIVDIKNRIDSENEFGGTYGIERWVNDIWYTNTNIYWKNDYYKKVYMRNVGPPYPTKNLSGCGSVGYPWGGLGASFPGVLFMFGQMEGKVWPYPTSGNIVANPPTAPSELIATGMSDTEIKLDWKDNSNNETNFIIEVSGSASSGFALLKEVGANITTYAHAGLPSGATRYYRVRAKNSGGNSSFSNVAQATTLVGVPAFPSELIATGMSDTEIKLDWKDNSNNETNFIIEVSGSASSGFALLKEVGANITTYAHAGLPSGATRYYRVRAKNSGGNSSFSNVAHATTLVGVPAPPSELIATGMSDTEIKLDWKDNSNNETNFLIEVSGSASSGFALLKEVGANITTYAHAGLPSGATRYYRVRAKNSGGNSSFSNVAHATTLVGVPAPPSELIATGMSDTEIKLDWKDNSNNETNFLIEVSGSASSGFALLKEVGANITTYAHTGLPSGATRYYRVRAKNSGGNSSFSNVAHATTQIAVPAAPSGLSATGTSISEIRLNWKDNSSNETAFVIEVSNKASSGFAVLKEVGSNTTSFTHTGLQAGITRYYRIMAKNGGGNSTYSNVANASTLQPVPTAPGTPTNLTATGISNHQIELKWRNNSINGTKFVLESSNSLNGDYVHLADINANIISFVHSDLTPNQTVYYRIKAENAVGSSGYSNVAVGSSLCMTSKILVTVNGSTSFCEGQSTVLSAPSGFSVYEWSGGQTADKITVDASGQYSVKVMDNYGCWSTFSDPVDVKVFPAPEKPMIITEADSLYTNLNTNHQWVLNNKTILGATYNYYIPLKVGRYSVIVTDKNGCYSQSETTYIDHVRKKIVKVYPNPNNGKFKIEIDNPEHFEYEIVVYSTLNETILQKKLSNFDKKIKDDIDVRQYGKGIYLIKIHHAGAEPIMEKVLVK
jgi:predicted phage tail protein